MKKIIYVSCGDDGHRPEYDRFFSKIFEEMHAQVEWVSDFRQAKDQKAVLFYSMFDGTPYQTLFALRRAAFRSILGRKTVGLFFRPEACLHAPTLKHQIKKALFRFTAHLPNVSILTIQPFAVCPAFSTIATNGIYDPQLWDLHYLAAPSEGSPELERRIAAAAQGKRIVVALGGQNASKGFDYLADLWGSSPKLRESFLFVAAGKVSEESLDKARQFEEQNGFLLNRFIDNDELFALYRSADIVWSCYSPQYNLASGIHGRAVQLGIPVLVREGSYLDKLGALIGHPTLALDFDNQQKASDDLLAWKPSHSDEQARTRIVTHMREHSLAILAKAIGTVHPAPGR